jgi:Tfp pilus assembly protein PilV
VPGPRWRGDATSVYPGAAPSAGAARRPMVCGMSFRALTRAEAARRLCVRLTGEAGSLLIETMVSAVIVLLVGAGVMSMMDRGSQLSAEQRLLATAANLAQSEQERLRAYSVGSLSNLRNETPPQSRTVNGVTYTITSRTDWIDEGLTTGTCTTAAGTPDYMKLTTSVTYPTIGKRKPITLESLVAPPARTFGPNEASLSVHVKNGQVPAAPIAGLTLNLTGAKTLSDVTSADGCVLWGFLPATGTYTVTGSIPGHVTPEGSPTITKTYNNLPGNQTTAFSSEYDLPGGIRATFTTKRSASAPVTSTAPQKAMVDHTDARFVAKAFNVTGDALDSGLTLWPFSSPYSIYAGSCTSAVPPTANLGSALAVVGAMSSPAAVQIPALNIHVHKSGVNVTNATVKVTSCGTTYTRQTGAAGLVDDPGFPYGDNLAVCVSDGSKKRTASVDNKTFPATAVSYDLNYWLAGSGPC